MNESKDVEEKVKDLIEERDAEYGSAWIVCTFLIEAVPRVLWNEFQRKGLRFFYLWIIILNKLCRILKDPYNKDSWIDIAGYAMLAHDYIESEKPSRGFADPGSGAQQ